MNKYKENKGKQYFYYKQGTEIILYNTETKQIEERERGDTPNFSYELATGYEPTIEGMQEYEKDFNKWCDEIKNCKALKIVYRKYWNDYIALTKTFNRQSNKEIRNQLDSSITMKEVKLIQQCNNGAHVYLNEQYINKKIKCYGYDYSGFYPWLMSLKTLMIPKTDGKDYILNSIDEIDIRKPGFYHVKISYINKNLCKIFQFSRDNMYDHTSIKFLKYLHNNMPKLFKEGDVTLELIQDGQPNAYVYDEWFTGDEVFGNWYNTMSKLKAEQPKNKLIKWLTSGLWGKLSRYNKVYIDDDESLEYDDVEYRLLNIDMYCDKDGNNTHVMINKEKPGTRHALLKSFLTSLGRKYIAEAMYKLDPTLNHTVRVYCDSIILDKEVKIPNTKNIKLMKPEEKSTGILFFGSRTSYYNYTTNEGHGKYKRNVPEITS